MTACYDLHPERIEVPTKEHGFRNTELWPGGVQELVNDGVDNCPTCTKGTTDHRNHGHVPVSWEREGTHGRCSYFCDVCGRSWTCSWALRGPE